MKYIVIFVVSFTLIRWGKVPCDQSKMNEDVECWGKQIDQKIDSVFIDSLTAVRFYNKMAAIEDSMDKCKWGRIVPTSHFLTYTAGYQFEKRMKPVE
ncbi:hypothetical protein [Chitinophaga varians]|uniref:hypothetical protein n=1 Tax=Chitinophaga varians TaxID=2202339 RepID=UPI00165F12B3|nr:hypothetical protein [Chitinophaga varians]MBC9909135.1 hypothetical protein [Chitinophaga varians]